MSKWVSVKDVMPEDLEGCWCPHEWVLVWNERTREFGIGRHIIDYGWELLGEKILFVPRGQKVCAEELDSISLPVTHWKQIKVPVSSHRKLYPREKKDPNDDKAYPF